MDRTAREQTMLHLAQGIINAQRIVPVFDR
jgi:hypothetical protein